MRVGPMDVFCYILGCENTHKGLVIDPAGEEERILETALASGIAIESVVNTHGHPDHTCGNRKIVEQTGAKIYMHGLMIVSSTHPMATRWQFRWALPHLLQRMYS